MYWKLEGNLLMVRLQTGEKILEKLRDAAKSSRLISGVVLSGIGMLKEVELGYFQNLEKGYQRHFIPFPCELVSLSGNISKQEDDFNIHLHACLIKPDGDSTGGHLFDGIVQYTNEIFILSLNQPLLRKKEDTGLYGLYFE
ncbi:MAG: DNA-binding protein [Caldiserica bacterium]|jgi:predicted DNA-binding protein with PD1-like motif|nr:DNA-binding protein [Caldisericota bacterium]MDH7561981.1 DNA-binding protein [Caldisericota bacterium]